MIIPNNYTIDLVINKIGSATFYAVVDNKLHEFVAATQRAVVLFDNDGKATDCKAEFIAFKEDDVKGIALDPKSLFASTDAFKNNNPIECSRRCIADVIYEHTKLRKTSVKCEEGQEQCDKLFGYVYDEKAMMPTEFLTNSITIEFIKEEGCSGCVCKSFFGIDVASSYDIYDNKESVIANYPYRKVDAQGNETIVRPEFYKIRPTEEQEAILAYMESIFAKAEEAGIKFIFDTEDYSLMAFNKEGLLDWGYEPEISDDLSEDNAADLGLVLRQRDISNKHGHMFTKTAFGSIGYDDVLSIKSDNYIKREQEKKAKKAESADK